MFFPLCCFSILVGFFIAFVSFLFYPFSSGVCVCLIMVMCVSCALCSCFLSGWFCVVSAMIYPFLADVYMVVCVFLDKFLHNQRGSSLSCKGVVAKQAYN